MKNTPRHGRIAGGTLTEWLIIAFIFLMVAAYEIFVEIFMISLSTTLCLLTIAIGWFQWNFFPWGFLPGVILAVVITSICGVREWDRTEDWTIWLSGISFVLGGTYHFGGMSSLLIVISLAIAGFSSWMIMAFADTRHLSDTEKC